MKQKADAISGIAVRGFKSICDERHIEIRPLTILAGANSSGKSSIMQPLLLLKQTLEETSDPGVLRLNGPHVRFTLADQLLSKDVKGSNEKGFSIRIETENIPPIETQFIKDDVLGFNVEKMTVHVKGNPIAFHKGLKSNDLLDLLPSIMKDFAKGAVAKNNQAEWRLVQERCFFSAINLFETDKSGKILRDMQIKSNLPSTLFVPIIKSVIHLPGLRGNPERTYQRLAVGEFFSGTFEPYVASVISQWQAEKSSKLDLLGENMQELGLSWKVEAKRVDDTQVELRVGRLTKGKRGGAKDMVSVADVGLGVSQSLPVLVALIEARPGQLVYLEQPEIHLHPKAQRKLAHVLCQAAKRGVRVVIETHSALLLREVQTLVAMGDMPEDDVKLHWFQRDKAGVTTVTTAELDENGAYGDWPEDFAETELEAERAFLDQVESNWASK